MNATEILVTFGIIWVVVKTYEWAYINYNENLREVGTICISGLILAISAGIFFGIVAWIIGWFV